MALVLNIGKCTLLGNYRENNEDSIEVKAFPELTVAVVADGTAEREWVAADLLAQAEHGPGGAAVLATSDKHGWATLISVLGAIGATSSALLAKAKNEALGVAAHLQAKLDADLVRDAVIVSPFPEDRTPWWHFW